MVRPFDSVKSFWTLTGIAAVLTVVIAWTMLRGAPYSVSLAPGAPALLAAAIEGSGLPLDGAGPVRSTDPDGPTPGIAERELARVPGRAAVTSALGRACAATGLAPATDPAEPDLVCSGRWHGQASSIHVATRCPNDVPPCSSTVEARVYP